MKDQTIEFQQNADAVGVCIAEESEEVTRRAKSVDAHQGWCQDAWTSELQEGFATNVLREQEVFTWKNKLEEVEAELADAKSAIHFHEMLPEGSRSFLPCFCLSAS